MKKFLQPYLFYILTFTVLAGSKLFGGIIIPTDSSQNNFLSMYKFVLQYAYSDLRFTNNSMDSILFPKYGEYSIYWIKTGPNRGSFVYPDVIPSAYSTVTNIPYSTYDWQSAEHYTIQYKGNANTVAIFQSSIRKNNNTVSWESVYFKNMLDAYLYNNIYYYVDDKTIDSSGINPSTQLLIIPSFTASGTDNKFYIDSVFQHFKQLKQKFDAFLAGGGMIYAEGNAVYFIEKLGYLKPGTVDFNNIENANPQTNLINIRFLPSNNPLAFTEGATGDFLYSNGVPSIRNLNAEVIAQTMSNNPVVFVLNGTNANEGKIVCNTGLPTVGGGNDIRSGSRQLQWTLNTFMYAFAKNVDVSRSTYNDLPAGITAGCNAVAYDAIDTFEVRVKVRNLTANPINDISIKETIRDFFSFVDVVNPDVNYTINGQVLQFSKISMPPFSEKVITYRLKTPPPDSTIHEKVNNYLSWADYIYTSFSVVTYSDNEGADYYYKWNNYAEIMFSAQIAADADLNWKNFLGLYYQPFKVFMIMENKERTPAMGTKYVQYIPKDVPFYWTDSKINIPILRTPGGKFVDVLRGSDDEKNPEYDMDHDGHPDVWLDTSSIYPKGYSIEEDSVYWRNPWEHLRSGDSLYYEDINHDGIRAIDTNGDGIVDIEAPGDKIRVWKVTWDIGKVAGYEYADPYCYYEIWVDPPDLVPMSAGVGYAYGKVKDTSEVAGMFYPYSKDINNPNLADTSWTNWMERDKNGNIIWKQLVWQKIDNYEGFTFIDTTKYTLKATDRVGGTVPQPHREFIAVLSLGGEEIDMRHPTPQNSLYSKITYKTIFNESKMTPIRTTYSYYAPLPNPLQFEFLSNCFQITDPLGNNLKYLPEWGKANITFNVDASTEYSYYWIRNAGYDVQYNDPSLAMDGIDSLGDGVFGYMIYDIPKGLGGYKITLPQKADGTYDIEKIVEIDGGKFQKWIDNPNTGDSVEIWEDQFQYHIYIPQLLIPPALDDDNHDGIDDWIDDRGDRFHSPSGYLHDAFMLGNGEDYPAGSPHVFSHQDDIYGKVDSGWSAGADNTYGDDYYEKLGITNFKFHVQYEGMGKEGPIDISKGGWLVVEEIFGGSPWVIFSHDLSGYSQGVDYRITAQPSPSMVKFGLDTGFIKYVVQDIREPHDFDINFDPYHVSYGYGESTVTTYSGGKDPCSLIEPEIDMPAIIDPSVDHKSITLVPAADKSNPDLKDYPKNVSGTFVEIRVEVMNGTDDNWVNTTVTPSLPPELGNSKVVMSYVSYPRPLVPAAVDPATGKIIQGGDDLGSFRAGWRFNQPEGEVLVKMGNKLPLLQPSRRAYFIFLISVDESLGKGVYTIDFALSGRKVYYDNTDKGPVSYDVPSSKFSITRKNSSGTPVEFQKLVIGTGSLDDINVNTSNYFTGLQSVKWSTLDINNTNFDTLQNTLPAKYTDSTNTETIDLSSFKVFPTVDNTKFNILEKGQIYSYDAGDNVVISNLQKLNYEDPNGNLLNVNGAKVTVVPAGPKLKAFKKIVSVNGIPFKDGESILKTNDVNKILRVLISVSNSGNDINQKATLNLYTGMDYLPVADSLPANCSITDNNIQANLGSLIPGQTKEMYLYYTPAPQVCNKVYNQPDVITNMDFSYLGTNYNGVKAKDMFSYNDKSPVDLNAYDFFLYNMSADKPEISKGSPVTITSYWQNGLLPADSVTLNVYAIIDCIDTVLIGQKVINQLIPGESSKYDLNYKVPDSILYIEFFSKIDYNNKYVEFCKDNNTQFLQIPFKGPDWIIDVKNYPNPMSYKTNFSYILPKDMEKISINIFTMDGKQIDKLDNCPHSAGKSTITWYPSQDIMSGSYIYRITGIDSEGNHIYNGKFSKGQ